MGQAKQRGTFEQRKAEALKRNTHERIVMNDLAKRQPSPKHSRRMTTAAIIAAGLGAYK